MAKNRIADAQKRVNKALSVFKSAYNDLELAAGELEDQIAEATAQQESLEQLKLATTRQLENTLNVRDKLAEFVV